jgi:hypothetical protein
MRGSFAALMPVSSCAENNWVTAKVRCASIDAALMHIQQPPAILTVPQLAKYVGASANTIYGLINNGLLSAFALNPESDTRKNWRVRFRDWEAFVDSQKSSRNGPLA